MHPIHVEKMLIVSCAKDLELIIRYREYPSINCIMRFMYSAINMKNIVWIVVPRISFPILRPDSNSCNLFNSRLFS